MLDSETADLRLQQMSREPNPGVHWDEECEGSACALVMFIGPSPGGKKQSDRPPRRTRFKPALWNQSWDEPFQWSPGFRVSFKPLVEALFARDYETAGKLVGLANMDWVANPQSEDVPVRYMWEGRCSVLRMLQEARPERR